MTPNIYIPCKLKLKCRLKAKLVFRNIKSNYLIGEINEAAFAALIYK